MVDLQETNKDKYVEHSVQRNGVGRIWIDSGGRSAGLSENKSRLFDSSGRITDSKFSNFRPLSLVASHYGQTEFAVCCCFAQGPWYIRQTCSGSVADSQSHHHRRGLIKGLRQFGWMEINGPNQTKNYRLFMSNCKSSMIIPRLMLSLPTHSECQNGFSTIRPLIRGGQGLPATHPPSNELWLI